MKFKDFLNESTDNYLNVKVGDILNALQNISEDMGVLGKKDSTTALVSVVNQIRPLLKSSLDKKHLVTLQRIAVHLMKSIENNFELKPVVDSCIESLKDILTGSKLPINKINKVNNLTGLSNSQTKEINIPSPPNQSQEENVPSLAGDSKDSSLNNL